MSARHDTGQKEMKMEKEGRIYYQECDGRLLNVYCYDEDHDEINLGSGEIVIDSCNQHVEGEPDTTLRRVK